jgi:hypothetical protein
MYVFWTHACVDCVLYTMIQCTYLCYMYDPNSVLGRSLSLRESQQAGKKRKTDTGLSERVSRSPAVQNTKKKKPNGHSKPPTATCTHTHTHYIIPPPFRSLLDIASLLKHPVASQRSPTFPSKFRRVRTPRAIGHYGNPTLQRLVTSFAISTAPSNFN